MFMNGFFCFHSLLSPFTPAFTPAFTFAFTFDKIRLIFGKNTRYFGKIVKKRVKAR